MNQSKKSVTIFNQRLAGFLMLHGFTLLGMTGNKLDASPTKKKNVFFFKNSEDLQKAINKWDEERKCVKWVI